MTRATGCLIAISMLSIFGHASAVTITFDSISPGSLHNSVVDSGYQITATNGPPFYITTGGSWCSAGCPSNGTPYLLTQAPQTLSLTSLNSTPFDFASFQFGERFTFEAGPSQISVVGNRADGSMVSEVFDFDHVNDGPGPLADFQTAFLSNSFSGLLSVQFNVGVFYAYSLDNLVVNPTVPATTVPEPAGPGLFAFGVGLLGILLRRRKRRQSLPADGVRFASLQCGQQHQRMSTVREFQIARLQI